MRSPVNSRFRRMMLRRLICYLKLPSCSVSHACSRRATARLRIAAFHNKHSALKKGGYTNTYYYAANITTYKLKPCSLLRMVLCHIMPPLPVAARRCVMPRSSVPCYGTARPPSEPAGDLRRENGGEEFSSLVHTSSLRCTEHGAIAEREFAVIKFYF
jgi:hypothetical protein